jgi:hypothetical protein
MLSAAQYLATSLKMIPEQWTGKEVEGSGHDMFAVRLSKTARLLLSLRSKAVLQINECWRLQFHPSVHVD